MMGRGREEGNREGRRGKRLEERRREGGSEEEKRKEEGKEVEKRGKEGACACVCACVRTHYALLFLPLCLKE